MMMQSLWALGASAFFSLMAVFVKFCSGHFGSMELVFYRSLVGIVMILVFVRSHGYSLKTQHIGGHLKRAFLGTATIGLWFFTIGEMPLGTNMTLIYTTPLYMAVNFLILAYMKKEKAPWGVVLAILCGFGGVTTVLQPTFDGGYLIPALICLFVAFIDLIVYWQIKELGDLKEPSWRIVFYFTLFGTIFGLLGAFTLEDGMHMPDTQSGLYLLGMGLCATFGQICTTRSYAYGNMLLSSCLGFSAIPFSALISYLLFGETLSLEGMIGMVLIIVAGIFATIYTKRTEAQNRAKAQKAYFFENRKDTPMENQKKDTNEQVWVCDALAITHCEVSDDAVIYTVTYADFMGLQRTIKLNREDCYFDFPNVLKALVKGGYRYNTMLVQAPSIIQQRLTSYRPEAEAVQKALEAVKH